MQYLGGKSKIRKQVSAFLESVRGGREYLEPFVGGAWVLQEMSGKRIASDGNDALIAMYKALQNGWLPPDFVSEEEWRKHRALRSVNKDPMTAFIGFGCSFSGKWFGGYAKDNTGRNYALNAKNSLMKQLPKIQDVDFRYGLFHEHKPENMLVYCDPPYEGTTQYGAFSGFDHSMFWDKMREWSKCNTVVISEYKAPNDFKCVAEFNSQMGMTTGKERPVRTERLFMYNGI